jgi:hypothetical protein
MPYIKQEVRDIITDGGLPVNAGELNYTFTKIILSYIQLKSESYQTYNDIIGALEGAKLELYRRKIAPYENKKIQENGDVY